jgi:hypothetical protein
MKEEKKYNQGYNQYIAALQAAENAFYASAQEEDDQEKFDKAKEAAEETFKAVEKRYETFQKEVDLYEESVDLSREQQEEIEKTKDLIQDLAYEKLQYKLDIKL